jgi:hypothetical protein
MPVILANQEAEIKRIMIQSPPGQIGHETQTWKNTSQEKADGVAQGVGSEFKTQYWKKEKDKSLLGGVAQVVECLPRKCVALTSNPSAA